MISLDSGTLLVYDLDMLKRLESGITISTRYAHGDLLLWLQGIATHLSLTGVASMKNDGGIKILAEGEEESLMELEKEIRSASFFPHAEDFYVLWKEYTGEFKDFGINYDPDH